MEFFSNKLPDDRAGASPLDMSQYKLLYGTTRIPQKGKDRIQYGRDFGEWAKHILVTRNGHVGVSTVVAPGAAAHHTMLQSSDVPLSCLQQCHL